MQKKPRAPSRTHIKASHEVIADALLKAGGSGSEITQQKVHQAVAKKIGISTSMLYKWRQPPTAGSGSPNPLDRTVSLMEATADTRIAEWLAQKAGGNFTPEESTSTTTALDKAANALTKEFGLFIAEVASAAEDHHITPDETQSIRSKWNILRQKTEAFVKACEKGNYTPPSPS
jgi:transposase